MSIDQYKRYFLKECDNIDEFWKELCPENPLGHKRGKFIYRGQRDDTWPLIPSILRTTKKINTKFNIKCEEQVHNELMILNYFVDQCDSIGISIINDSLEFRKKYLDFKIGDENDKFSIDPSNWPSEELLELMALAQHCGVPTSLIDWSRRSYVAAYFAASSSLKHYHKNNDKKLAVWALDIEKVKLYKNVKLIKVPGSTSNNLAAQSGLFTFLKQPGKRGDIFSPKFLENEFENTPDTPLWKITLPVTYSVQILKLCKLYGISGATLFPNYNGVSRSVSDYINTILIN